MKKSFDCVQMKHKGAMMIYEETKDMTTEQKMEYWLKLSKETMKHHKENRDQESSIR